jgi:hypothetical protein
LRDERTGFKFGSSAGDIHFISSYWLLSFKSQFYSHPELAKMLRMKTSSKKNGSRKMKLWPVLRKILRGHMFSEKCISLIGFICMLAFRPIISVSIICIFSPFKRLDSYAYWHCWLSLLTNNGWWSPLNRNRVGKLIGCWLWLAPYSCSITLYYCFLHYIPSFLTGSPKRYHFLFAKGEIKNGQTGTTWCQKNIFINLGRIYDSFRQPFFCANLAMPHQFDHFMPKYFVLMT